MYDADSIVQYHHSTQNVYKYTRLIELFNTVNILMSMQHKAGDIDDNYHLTLKSTFRRQLANKRFQSNLQIDFNSDTLQR